MLRSRMPNLVSIYIYAIDSCHGVRWISFCLKHNTSHAQKSNAFLLGRVLHHISSPVSDAPSVSLHLHYTNVCIMATERILRRDWLRSTHDYRTLKNNGTESAACGLNTMLSLSGAEHNVDALSKGSPLC